MFLVHSVVVFLGPDAVVLLMCVVGEPCYCSCVLSVHHVVYMYIVLLIHYVVVFCCSCSVLLVHYVVDTLRC